MGMKPEKKEQKSKKSTNQKYRLDIRNKAVVLCYTAQG